MSLNPSTKELNLLARITSSAVNMVGQKAILFPVLNIEKNINRDIVKIDYGEGIDIHIMFEDNPRPIMKKYGWNTENEDASPYVIHIFQRDDNGIQIDLLENALIEIFPLNTNINSMKFKITQVRFTDMLGLCYLCKCVPYRESVKIEQKDPSNNAVINNKDVGTPLLKGIEDL